MLDKNLKCDIASICRALKTGGKARGLPSNTLKEKNKENARLLYEFGYKLICSSSPY